MYKFTIELERDTRKAKKIGGLLFVLYDKLTEPIYNTLVKKGLKTLFKDFTPVKQGNKLIFSEESNDKQFIDREKSRLEAFLLFENKDFMDSREVKMALSSRVVKIIGDKVKSNILNDNCPLSFLNKWSIFVSWKIETIK